VISKFDKGESIHIDDLKIYNHLSKEDIASDPLWEFAPVLVSTNHERMNITKSKASLWAKKHNTYAFKWKANVKNHINPAPSHIMPQVLESNAFFWQYFVEGASAFLTENLNGGLALVNGTPIVMESLILSSQSEYNSIKSLHCVWRSSFAIRICN